MVRFSRTTTLVYEGGVAIAKAKVIVYSRPGCHLCEVAKAVIEASQCADYYVLEEVNIEKEPVLLERYKNDVPVITINGVEAFRHRLKSEDFRLRILGHQESAK